MNRPKNLFTLGWVFFCIFATCLAHAAAPQTPLDVRETTLGKVAAFLDNSQAKQATNLLATIKPGDPDFPAAQFYRAAALHQLGDDHRFLEEMTALATNQAAVPADLKEQMALDEVAVLLQYRRFDDVLSKANTFIHAHPASARLAMANEYRMAGTFERGMKNADDAAAVLKDENQFNRRWNEVQTNLQDFLAWGSTVQRTNYSFLARRSLQEDIWTARICLGQDQPALAELQDPAQRERFEFLRARLYRRNHKDLIDQNIQFLSEFLTHFPASKYRPWIIFQLANFTFHKGKDFCLQADTIESTDSAAAGRLRAAARPYFADMRSLQNQIVADKLTGIEMSDVVDYRDDVLETYYLERDFSGLASASSALVANATPGDGTWMVAKFYNGLAILNQTGADSNQAAAVLDEVLAQGFTNKQEHDHWIIAAAKWRTHIAVTAHDLRKGAEIVELVDKGNCPKNLKTAFLKVYGYLGQLPKN